MIPTLFLLFVVQQPDPLDTFRKIEESLNKAPCLRVGFTYQSVALKEGLEDLRGDASGTLVVKEGDRLRAVIPLPGKLPPATLVADGERLSCTWRGLQRSRTCAGSGKWLSSAFARAGAYRGGSCFALLLMKAPKELPDVGQEMPVTDLAFAESEKDKTLTYSVTLGAGHESARIQLWYDPITFLPTKRVIWLKNPEHRITETYSEISLNADVAADQFALPAAVSPK